MVIKNGIGSPLRNFSLHNLFSHCKLEFHLIGGSLDNILIFSRWTQKYPSISNISDCVPTYPIYIF